MKSKSTPKRTVDQRQAVRFKNPSHLLDAVTLRPLPQHTGVGESPRITSRVHTAGSHRRKY